MTDTLVATALGGLLAAAGGFIGQWWAERRAREREARAAELEAHRWARELRRVAYVEFLLSFRDTLDDVRRAQFAGVDPPGSEELSTMLDKTAAVQLLGSQRCALIADAMCSDLIALVDLPGEQDETNFVDLREDFDAAARADLGLPD